MKRMALAAAWWIVASAPAATLTVEVKHGMGNVPLRMEQPERLADGREVSITRLDYFITEFALLTTDGRALRADEQAAFLSAGRERSSFTIPNVPRGEFAGVAFRVGVPEGENERDGASWPAGHPLNPAVNGLHWGWQGGYVFLALEGREGDGGFSFHLARAENLMTVRLEKPVKIADDTTVELRFDVARLFEELGLRNDDGSNSTHSAPGDPVAARLRANVAGAWTLTGLRAGAARGTVAVAATIPAGTTPFTFPIPNGFPPPELPPDNPLTIEGVALGQRLFNDPILSSTGRQSCASCHQPEHGFSDSRPTSLGAEGQSGTRNAPTLLNLAWHSEYAWDGRRPTLRAAAVAPISDAREMRLPLARAVERLAAGTSYAADFARAFGVPLGGTGAVTAEHLGMALEQFLLTRVAADSKFDRMLRGEAQLSEEEALGFRLFNTEYDPVRGQRGADCFHCHGGFDFSDHAFHDTGLGGADPGRFAATGRETDRGKFKTPTLRNLTHSAPYFHDGRAATLAEAVAHYDHGVRREANLDPNLAKRRDLDLAPEEHRALVAFLRTLSAE